jgi:hypothetical protein
MQNKGLPAEHFGHDKAVRMHSNSNSSRNPRKLPGKKGGSGYFASE